MSSDPLRRHRHHGCLVVIFFAAVLAVAGCGIVDMLLTPPTDTETGEVTGDSPAVEIVKTVIPESDGGVNWRENVLYGLITAQNLYLQRKRLAKMAGIGNQA